MSNPYSQELIESLNKLHELYSSAPANVLSQEYKKEILKVIHTLLFVVEITPEDLSRFDHTWCAYPENNPDKYISIHFETICQLTRPETTIGSARVYAYGPIKLFTNKLFAYMAGIDDPANNAGFMDVSVTYLVGTHCLERRMEDFRDFILQYPDLVLTFSGLVDLARREALKKFGDDSKYFLVFFNLVMDSWKREFLAQKDICERDGFFDESCFDEVYNLFSKHLDHDPLLLSESGFSQVVQHIAVNSYPPILLDRFFEGAFSIPGFAEVLLAKFEAESKPKPEPEPELEPESALEPEPKLEPAPEPPLLQTLIALEKTCGVRLCYAAAAAGHLELLEFFMGCGCSYWTRSGLCFPLEVARDKLDKSPEDARRLAVYECLLRPTLKKCSTSSSATDPTIEKLMLSLDRARALSEAMCREFAPRIDTSIHKQRLHDAVLEMILNMKSSEASILFLFDNFQLDQGKDVAFVKNPKNLTLELVKAQANPLFAAIYRENTGLVQDFLPRYLKDSAKFYGTLAYAYGLLAHQECLGRLEPDAMAKLERVVARHLDLCLLTKEGDPAYLAYYIFQHASPRTISSGIQIYNQIRRRGDQGVEPAPLVKVALDVYEKLDRKRRKWLLEELYSQRYDLQPGDLEAVQQARAKNPALKAFLHRLLYRAKMLFLILSPTSQSWMAYLALEDGREDLFALWMNTLLVSFKSGKNFNSEAYGFFSLPWTEAGKQQVLRFIRSHVGWQRCLTSALIHAVTHQKEAIAVKIAWFFCEANLPVGDWIARLAVKEKAWKVIKALMPYFKENRIFAQLLPAAVQSQQPDKLCFEIIRRAGQPEYLDYEVEYQDAQHTALSLAVVQNRVNLVKRLLEASANPHFEVIRYRHNHPVAGGHAARSLLDIACSHRQLEIMGLLFKASHCYTGGNLRTIEIMIEGGLSWESFVTHFAEFLAKASHDHCAKFMVSLLGQSYLAPAELNRPYSSDVKQIIVNLAFKRAIVKKNEVALINLMRIPGVAPDVSNKKEIARLFVKSRGIDGLTLLLKFKPSAWADTLSEISTARNTYTAALLNEARTLGFDDKEQWDNLGQRVTCCLEKDDLITNVVSIHDRTSDVAIKRISAALLAELRHLYDLTGFAGAASQISAQARVLEAKLTAEKNWVTRFFSHLGQMAGHNLEARLRRIEQMDLPPQACVLARY